MKYLQLSLVIYSLVLTSSLKASEIRLFQTRNQQKFASYNYYLNKGKKELNKSQYTGTQYQTYKRFNKIKPRINQLVFHKKSYKLPSQPNSASNKNKPNINISYQNQLISKYQLLLRSYKPSYPLQTPTSNIIPLNLNCIYYSAGKVNCLNNQKQQQKSVSKEFQPHNVKQITLYQIINKTSKQSRIESQKINLQIPPHTTQSNITRQLPTWYLNPEPIYQVPIYNNTKLNNSLKNESNLNITQQQNQTSRDGDLPIDEIIKAPVIIYYNISDEFNLNNSINQSLLPVPTISASKEVLRSSLINAQYQTNNPIMFIGQTSLQARNGIQTQKIRQLFSTQNSTSFPLNINN